jgi:hypothetical protein
MSKAWLRVWLISLACVVGAAGIAVWRLGLAGLPIAALVLAFYGSLPAWWSKIVPTREYNPAGKTAGGGPPKPASVTSSEPNQESGPASKPSQAAASSSTPKTERHAAAGSPEFADLVHELAAAIPDAVRIDGIGARAGVSQNFVRQGFVDAVDRWQAVLAQAIEDGVDTRVCQEAQRTSRRPSLHSAIAAYLNS